MSDSMVNGLGLDALIAQFSRLSNTSKESFLKEFEEIINYLEEHNGQYVDEYYISQNTIDVLTAWMRPWVSSMNVGLSDTIMCGVMEPSVVGLPYMSVCSWNDFFSAKFQYIDEKWPCPTEQPEPIDYDEVLTLLYITEYKFNGKYAFSPYVHRIMNTLY